jgi:hypothetical protein
MKWRDMIRLCTDLHMTLEAAALINHSDDNGLWAGQRRTQRLTADLGHRHRSVLA